MFVGIEKKFSHKLLILYICYLGNRFLCVEKRCLCRISLNLFLCQRSNPSKCVNREVQAASTSLHTSHFAALRTSLGVGSGEGVYPLPSENF